MTEKTELKTRLSRLQKLEDAKDFNKNKNLSTGPAANKKSSSDASGFSIVHLVLVALISLLVGALLGKTSSV